ncbi:MAG: hypothetical protein WD511_00350 [Balneolaceae bacterium]
MKRGYDMKFSIRRINEWLIVLGIVILLPLSFMYVQEELNLLPYDSHYLFNMHPSTSIMAISTQDAISVFGGEETQGYTINWRTASMYFNVILYFMIGPFLLYKGFKRSKDHEERRKPWYWYIGGAICLGALSMIPVEIMHLNVFENTKESAAISREKDLMRMELAKVGFATAQHEIVEDGVNESFRIEDLNMNDLQYDYSFEGTPSDTFIIISASSPDNADHRFRMEVRPYNESVLKIRN